MPEEYKSSWADEVELDSGDLPPPTESYDSQGNKYLTDYKFNKDDKKVKTVRTYKVTKHVVSKSVARRKKLPKFGDSAKDAVGPNPHTTFVSEDISMQMITSKEEEKSTDAVLDPKSMFNTITLNYLVAQLYNSFQINLPNVVSATELILQPIVLIATPLRILKRFLTPSRHLRHPLQKHLRLNQENTFHLSSRINRRGWRVRRVTIQLPFVFPICQKAPVMLIWKTSRTNLERNRKCIWQRTRTLVYAKVLPTFISITRKMLLPQSKLSMDLDMII